MVTAYKTKSQATICSLIVTNKQQTETAPSEERFRCLYVLWVGKLISCIYSILVDVKFSFNQEQEEEILEENGRFNSE